MLARLLRAVYLFQLISGALLGSYFALLLTDRGAGAFALLWIPLCALALPVLLQFLTILALMLRTRAATPWFLWWRACWGESKAALLIFMLRQPWPDKPMGIRQPTAQSGAKPGHGSLPVLLVHGFICNHRVWDDMAISLQRAGHPVLRVDLEPLFTSIDNYAATLERSIDTLLLQTGSKQVVLVGHSMGGLAIRAWLRAYGSQRVARILTLGTPHQGTQIARGSMTPNGAQMAWHSDWLQALAASENDKKRTLMHTAITAQDNVVFPQTEQVLAGAQVKHFQGIGHMQMCLDLAVIDWVCQQAGVTQPVAALS